jgi:hypothetical protein
MRPTSNSQSGSAPGPSIQLTTDAVVASYIHAISDRHHREDGGVEDPAAETPGEWTSRDAVAA